LVIYCPALSYNTSSMFTGSLEHPTINSNKKGINFLISDSNSVIESNKTTIYKQKASNRIRAHILEEND